MLSKQTTCDTDIPDQLFNSSEISAKCLWLTKLIYSLQAIYSQQFTHTHTHTHKLLHKNTTYIHLQMHSHGTQGSTYSSVKSAGT